jgi:hypothetical protein
LPPTLLSEDRTKSSFWNMILLYFLDIHTVGRYRSQTTGWFSC